MKGEDVIIDRGQFYGSLRFMEKGTAFSTKEIRKILKDLKKGTLITMKNVAGQTMITICNYSLYQKNDDEKKEVLENKKGKPRAQQGHSKGTAKGTKYNKSNNNNNINNNLLPGFEEKKTEPNLDLEFEQFWKDYGKHGNKKTAKDKYIKIRKTISLEILQDGNKKYDKYLSCEEWLKKKHLATWLHKECWKDEFNNGTTAEQINHTDGDWMVLVKRFHETGKWNWDDWGPEPDMNGNRVPEHILRENGFNTTTEAGK